MRASRLVNIGLAGGLLIMATGGCSRQRVDWESSGNRLTIRLGTELPLELRRIEPGGFLMGAAPQANARFSVPENERPQHAVTLERPFYIAVHETTNEHFQRFQPEHDSNVAKAGLPENIAARAGSADLNEPRLPVVGVSHAEAEEYCEWLSRESGLTVRLPSEAEWEYACRAGTDSAYSWGDARPEAGRHANLADPQTAELLGGLSDAALREDGSLLARRVASQSPNNYGLFDMHGNVGEWCSDIYTENYSNAAPDGSPAQVGPLGEEYVVRGGSWASGMEEARSSARDHRPAGASDSMTGFRIVVEAPPADEDAKQAGI